MKKKKEDPYIKYAEPRDLTIENWNIDIDKQIKDSLSLTWRTKAYVIYPPSIEPRISGQKPICCCCPCGSII